MPPATTNDSFRRCACGYTDFHNRTVSTTSTETVWVYYSSPTGLGQSYLGTLMGGGDGSGFWGTIEAPITTSNAQVVCKSCGRARSSVRNGAQYFAGSYVFNNKLYMVLANAGPSACYSVKFVGTTSTASYETYVYPSADGVAPIVYIDPPPDEEEESPPAGAEYVANTIWEASLPLEVDDTDVYTVILFNRCAGTSSVLGTVFIEEPTP